MLEFVAFVLMALAAVWLLLRSVTKASRSGGGRLREFLLRGYPIGTFRPYTGERSTQLAYKLFVWLTYGIAFLGFYYVLVNVPALFELGTVYALATLAGLVGILANALSPERTILFASPRFLGERGLIFDLGLGGAITVAHALFFLVPFGIGLIGFPLAAEPALLLMAVLLIPLAEETLFSVLAATALEQMGVIYAIISSSSIFAIFHVFVSGMNLPFLAGAFIFRALATAALALTKSMVPGLSAHIAINLLALM